MGSPSGTLFSSGFKVLSGSVATGNSDFSGFRPIFGKTWPQNLSRTTGLVLQCRLHQQSEGHGGAPEGPSLFLGTSKSGFADFDGLIFSFVIVFDGF